MNTRYFIIICLLLSLTISSLAQTKKIVILHTNDTHSHIEPLDSNDSSYPNRGGIARRQAYVESVRASEKNVLVLDAGDFSQGTIYYNFFKGQLDIECMNQIGYNATTLGNHEFDSGLKHLEGILRKAKFPAICTNYDASMTNLKNLIKPYHIIKINGVRIGIIGLGIRLEGIVQHKNYQGIRFIEPYKIAEETAQFLKGKKKCDLVVCLSHLGLNKESNSIYNDRELAAKTASIDIIISGHSHVFMKEAEFIENTLGHRVIVSQAGEKGIFIGRIDIILAPRHTHPK